MVDFFLLEPVGEEKSTNQESWAGDEERPGEYIPFKMAGGEEAE